MRTCCGVPFRYQELKHSLVWLGFRLALLCLVLAPYLTVTCSQTSGAV